MRVQHPFGDYEHINTKYTNARKNHCVGGYRPMYPAGYVSLSSTSRAFQRADP